MKFNRKLVVIGAASALWLIVSIVRLPDSIASNAEIGIDTSWVVGLPAALAQHYVAGRDFYFMYGPLAQVIAFLGAWLHTPWSPIDSLPLILLAFSITSLLLLGLILCFLKELDATACLLIYACSAALNLFSEPTSFRVLILILSAALITRALTGNSAGTMWRWAAAAGCVAVAGQLITVELGPYALIAALAAVAVQAFKKRSRYREFLVCGSSLAAAYILGNILICTAFAVSSQGHRFFDYQRYSFELMRGYNYTSGIAWEFGKAATAVLGIVALFTIVSTVWIALNSESSTVLLPLLLVSLLALKSAVTRSDVGHITQSVSPLIFTFLVIGYLFLRERDTRYTAGAAWAAVFVALFVIWPWSSRSALKDLTTAATHSPLARLAVLRTVRSDATRVLPAGVDWAATQSDRQLVPFPHEVYIPVALHRPMLSPVFQSFLASPPKLQEYYVDRLERVGPQVNVIYDVDDSGGLDGVQSISRVPRLFEYLYRSFSLSDDAEAGCRFCLLSPGATHDELKARTIAFQSASDHAGQEIRPEAPASCSFVKLNMEIDYPLARFIGHAAPVDVKVSQAGALLLKTALVPIEVNAPFSTYVSLIPPNMFATVFRHRAVPQIAWDDLRIDVRSADWTGVRPSVIHVTGLGCVTI